MFWHDAREVVMTEEPDSGRREVPLYMYVTMLCGVVVIATMFTSGFFMPLAKWLRFVVALTTFVAFVGAFLRFGAHRYNNRTVDGIGKGLGFLAACLASTAVARFVYHDL